MCKGPSETCCPERSKTGPYSWAQSEGEQGGREHRPHRPWAMLGILVSFPDQEQTMKV